MKTTKLLSQLGLAASLAFASSASQAVIVNFIDLADGSPGEGGYDEYIVDSILTVEGDPGNNIYAYLDETNSSGNGGLGVCQSLVGDNGSACADPADDNVTEGERLRFTFSEAVTITSIWVNNNHDDGFDGGDVIKVAGPDITNTDYAAIRADNTIGMDETNDLLQGASFELEADEFFRLRYVNEQFYVSAIEYTLGTTTTTTRVPEPAGLFLLGIGLMGLSWARKRVS